jgi:hypothetical protein
MTVGWKAWKPFFRGIGTNQVLVKVSTLPTAAAAIPTFPQLRTRFSPTNMGTFLIGALTCDFSCH